MSDTADFAALERREWADPGVARSYAQAFAKASDMVVPALVETVRAGPGMRALDLCCGHGNVTAGLVRAGAEVVGLDFSAAMLDMARADVPGADFREGDAMALELDDAAFDAVTIGFGLPHVPDPPQVLSEARRVLKPGGRIAFSVWCGPEVDGAMAYVFEAIGRHGDPAITLPPGPGATDYADAARAFPALEAAGFGEPDRVVVPSGWVVTDPAAPFEYFRDGTARGGALLRPQPEPNSAAIREAVVALVLENHGPGPQWIVPIPAVVISAAAV